MATFTLFDAFLEDVAEGVHNLASGALIWALTNAANAPDVAADGQLSDLTTIAYTNLSSRAITTASSSQTAGLYKLVINDLVLSASGGAVAPFRYLNMYNDTAAADELIGLLDYGSDLTLANGESLTVDADGTNGILQLSEAA
jgi:hypothetical protein